MYNVTDTYRTLISSPTRYTGVHGAVRLKNGTIIQLDDSNIDSGTLQIINKLNRRGDFRPGGVYSGELSVGLRGFAGKTSDLDGAVIRLNYSIYPDASMSAAAAETVPLGRYYVDGSTIKRRNDVVKFCANDALVLFDIPSTARSGTLFELVDNACSAAGVAFGMTQPEFEALPNGTLSASIDITRVQTEHDLLMYVGMMTASFARIRRQDGALEFRPLTCSKNSGGVIVPEREINGNIRFNTEFSDDTTRVARIITRKKGSVVSSSIKITAGGSEKLSVLELDDNPLTAEMSDEELTGMLDNELSQLYECLNRVYDISFTGDPALDIGDYVRMRGGAIDTARGYVTGMITSQTWRYRGQHAIKCTMPSSLTAFPETAAVTLALDNDATAAEETPRTQPRSQLQKQIDELNAKLGNSSSTAERLQGADSDYYATTSGYGFAIYKKGNAYDELVCHIQADTDGSTGLKIGNTSGYGIEFLKDYAGFQITSRNNFLRLDENSAEFLSVYTSTGHDFRVAYQNGGIAIKCDRNVLQFGADGLYYNGTKIG